MTGGAVKISGFPRTVSAEEVTQFLEELTGTDTVIALKVRLPRIVGPSTGAYAILQFASAKLAEDASSMARQGLLRYKCSYLTVERGGRANRRKPRSNMFKLEHAVLHIGWQFSHERLSVLWSWEDVEVRIGFDSRKLQFFLPCHGSAFKLELYYENIKQIQLHHHQGQEKKFIIIQLKNAPRIYKKVMLCSEDVREDPTFNYFRDASDSQWIRETDFTLHSCIGQSPTMCLEVPRTCELPDIQETFIYFKEIDAELTLAGGFSFCQGSGLVPIVVPPHREIQLPCSILFKVNSLLQKGLIVRPTLDDEFFSLLNPYSINNNYIDYALEALSHLNDICFEPTRWLREQYREYEMSGHLPKLSTLSLEPGLVYIQVTPTKVYFCGPEVNESNRELQNFSDDSQNFLRVSFVNEDWEKIWSMDFIQRIVSAHDERHTNLHRRILSILRDGIVIGEKKFEFLAISFSQLRENSVWLFASRSGLTAADIRDWMGDFRQIRNVAKFATRLGQSFGSSKETFTVMKNEIEFLPEFEFLAFSSSQLCENSIWMFASRSGLMATDIREWMGDSREIRNVAKYAARLGQSFGSSKETFTVMKNDVEFLLDIETEDGKYNFSNGIGKISADIAQAIAAKCNISSASSVFQIRYGGYKGVVAVASDSTFKLSLRNSMCKYKSENTKLDVLAWSKYRPCYLNRQPVTLLSTLGVEDDVFETKQQEALRQLDMILTDPVQALEALEVMSPKENTRVVRRMLECGYRPHTEPFLCMMLQIFRAAKLWELRTKTKIFVPEARLMMWCLDETGTLEYGQVFVNISCVGRPQFYEEDLDMAGAIELQSSEVLVVKVVARNPCLYPGNVRVLMAVDVPALHHMVDCVVFPQKGKRPHPNACSGSDLDGDLYFVCWDSALIPPHQIPPMEYEPAPPAVLDQDVQIEEVQGYFADTTRGRIGPALLVFLGACTKS